MDMFPPTAFSPFSSHYQPWFADRLRRLEEASIRQVERLTLRFLWLRGSEPPLVIRVTERRLEAKMSRILLPRIIYREHRELPDEEIYAHFRALEFWYREDPPTRRRRPDGDHYLLEAAEPGRYRAMREHAPTLDSPLRRFCHAMLALTKVEVPVPRRPRTGRRIICCRAKR